MLRIRPAQMAVLSELEVRKFEDWMVVHLRRFFPDQCAAIGERRLLETIRYGIRRAAHYGFTAKRDVCKYIDLMIVFGRDFDTGQRTPWAAEILKKRALPGAKMQALFAAAKLRLNS